MNLLKKLLHYTTQLLVNSLDSKLKNQESSLEDSFTSFYIWELSLSIHVWEWGPSFEFLDPGIHPQFLIKQFNSWIQNNNKTFWLIVGTYKSIAKTQFHCLSPTTGATGSAGRAFSLWKL